MFYKFLFFNCLIFSTLVSISSFSWMGMWMGLEINLLSIIPLMVSNNKYSSESAIKYFVTQALASTLILFSIILLIQKMNFNVEKFYMLLINTALLIKMGAAPFHFWFPEIMDGLSWNNNLILLTWQKIAPMILLMYNIKISFFFILIILSCMIISAFMGLNQISLRKILTYSSINNIGWMIPLILYSQLIWTIYFMIYTLITINIVIIFSYYNIFYINQMLIMMNNDFYIKIMMFFNMLNLGGIPPFMGFYSKWLTINLMTKMNFYFIITIMILLTLVVLYYYLRLMFSTMTMSHLMMKKNFLYKNKILMINMIILLMSPILFIM
uniref:NADH-ubiquinone oxidoreductase chain 2 n=1 Tax=Malachiinae sp. GENSP01 TaxID=1205562 RepID=A0A0S2MQI0_9CUCU|nr:NADH deshydrogenase subunit 2 [Malachiinae sp. GENSP01]